MLLKVEYFQKENKEKDLQVFQIAGTRPILPITLAQVKAGNTSETCNTSENVLNEISKIIYSLYQANEITKNVYNNIMNSIQSQNRMDTILMNSGNSKTSDPRRALLNLSDKIILKKKDRYVAL